MSLMSLWNRHPAVPTGRQLTVGQRSADRLRSIMGSWPFVFCFLGGMAVWAAANSAGAVIGVWDAYPFILLNLFLSMLAGLQGAILLIAAKRSDEISAQLALHDYETDVAAAVEITALHELTAEVHQIVSVVRDHIANTRS